MRERADIEAADRDDDDRDLVRVGVAESGMDFWIDILKVDSRLRVNDNKR